MTDRKRPPASEHMIARGRQLRQEMTFPERLLWSRLRDCRLAGLRFRRQHPVVPYVADYFCPSAKVVMELDGRSHDGQRDKDQQRQDYLERQGLRVIRFSNDSVLKNLNGVLEAITAACKAGQKPASAEQHPHPHRP
jgi:very-short-patch-repair endonuclease